MIFFKFSTKEAGFSVVEVVWLTLSLLLAFSEISTTSLSFVFGFSEGPSFSSKIAKVLVKYFFGNIRTIIPNKHRTPASIAKEAFQFELNNPALS